MFAQDGHVDILHNNAGIGHGGNIEATTVEDWQRVIGVNLLGVAYGVQAFIPRMLQQGRPASVVNTASITEFCCDQTCTQCSTAATLVSTRSIA